MAITREKFKTYKNVFDAFTNRNLFKLSSQGYFSELESPISIGKEANIFTALKKDNTRVIVKIYRLSNCDFNLMYQYMKEDPRYVSVKRRRRDVVFAWAKREFMNLLNAREAQVNVPTVHGFLSNIVIMEYMGDDVPAPKLNKKKPQDPAQFLSLIVREYRKLYAAKMVHGDLSPFNILNDNEMPVFIDMSQTTTLENPHAETYLKRDLKNISTYFNKHGVKTSVDELYAAITN
jgi:RIO kinase 1